MAWALLLAAAPAWAEAPHASPYQGQQSRGIKAVSADEIEGLLAGHGLGFARAAELNGYPGPAHVLELADSLDLSSEQRNATRALHSRMETRAKTLGVRLVAAEARLEALFRAGDATHDSIGEALAEIARVRADLRGTHLSAHVDQRALLSAEQADRYARLRGYHGHAPAPHGHHH